MTAVMTSFMLLIKYSQSRNCHSGSDQVSIPCMNPAATNRKIRIWHGNEGYVGDMDTNRSVPDINSVDSDKALEVEYVLFFGMGEGFR